MSGRIVVSPVLRNRIKATGYDYVITGVSGWLGRALLDLLESSLGEDIAERVHVFASRDRDIHLASGRVLPGKRLERGAYAASRPTIVLHCAFLTRDKLESHSAADFVASNTAISEIMDAMLRTIDVRGFFMPSSGAVYSKGSRELSHDDVANPYGALKLRDEHRFGEWARQASVPAFMPRVFNLAGPYINKPQHYALASMICSALEQGAITIRSDRIVKRSYVHIANLLELALEMLLAPRSNAVHVFDTAGHEIVEMGDLAALVRDALGTPTLPIQRPQIRDGDEDVYVGDGSEFLKALETRAVVRLGMSPQIEDTAAFLRDDRSWADHVHN